MTSKNTWDGLQFRVMETLEQAKGVPLTAMEISQRLHETEYRHELKDNVVFKVTRACHAMREKGRIIVTDAKDREGRLTYALPQRVIFPRKEEDTMTPPANPVLRPEDAEKIKPVERKEEPQTGHQPWLSKLTPEERSAHAKKLSEARWGKDGAKAPKAPKAPKARKAPAEQTNMDKIEAILDAAPHPLAALEIEPMVAGLWPDGKIRARLATTLYWMEKERRIFQQPSTKRVKGTKFEYYTRKTGKSAPARPPVATKPVQAPLPSQVWKEPEQPTKTYESASPAMQPAMRFRPIAPKAPDDSITLKVTSDDFRKINAEAKKFGISIEDFCRQAIDFALSHTE